MIVPSDPILHIHRTDDMETLEKVTKALEANDFYCPCKVDRIPENKCMCKEFREQITIGFCPCGLYIKSYVKPIET